MTIQNWAASIQIAACMKKTSEWKACSWVKDFVKGKTLITGSHVIHHSEDVNDIHRLQLMSRVDHSLPDPPGDASETCKVATLLFHLILSFPVPKLGVLSS